MLTDRQRSVLDFIQREQREKGVTPSTREIQNHFGFASQTSVMQYIAALERKGFLDRHARKARALITPAMKVRITDIPIYGQIPAGMSALTEQSVEGHVSLDMRSANVLKNRGTFALRVRGDSMVGAHIVDGDIVILEDTREVHDGDIVAALIDGETSLKRYVVERGRPYLKAENPRYPDLVPARELKIQGVMVSLIRKQERRKRSINVHLNVLRSYAMLMFHGCKCNDYRSSQAAGGAFPPSIAHRGDAFNYRLTFS
jgi:repressor LexA